MRIYLTDLEMTRAGYPELDIGELTASAVSFSRLCCPNVDQPFVSVHNPAPPGSMVVVSLRPSVRYMERSGMASGTRNMAIKLWNVAHLVAGALGARALARASGADGPSQVLAATLMVASGGVAELAHPDRVTSLFRHAGGGELRPVVVAERLETP